MAGAPEGLQQGEDHDRPAEPVQLRELVGPREAQRQVGHHEVQVEGPPVQQLLRQHRLPEARAEPLACTTGFRALIFRGFEVTGLKAEPKHRLPEARAEPLACTTGRRRATRGAHVGLRVLG